MKFASWLTAKRIRIHGLLLAVCLWTIYAVDMSTPGLIDRNGLVKGTDFLHFYTLGNLALRGRGDLLYDMRAQAELTHQFVSRAPDSVYVALYGPQMSLFFAPFARLSYGWALTAWLALNLLIYAFCCYAVWKKCPSLHAYRWTDCYPGGCFSRAFSSLRLGADLRSRAVVLHSGISGAGKRSSPAGRTSHWFSDLQTTAGTSRSSRLCIHSAMEGCRWRCDGCRPPTFSRLAALRQRDNAQLLAYSDSRRRSFATARTPAVPDPFVAIVLVSAATLAARCIRSVCDQRSRRSSVCNSRVEEWIAAELALFGVVIGNGSDIPSLDCLRLDNSGASIPVAR